MKKCNKEILQLILLNRRTVCGETYCSLSQTEMATVLGCNRYDIYRSLKELSAQGLVIKVPNTVRKYALTDAGRKLIKVRKSKGKNTVETNTYNNKIAHDKGGLTNERNSYLGKE